MNANYYTVLCRNQCSSGGYLMMTYTKVSWLVVTERHQCLHVFLLIFQAVLS